MSIHAVYLVFDEVGEVAHDGVVMEEELVVDETVEYFEEGGIVDE